MRSAFDGGLSDLDDFLEEEYGVKQYPDEELETLTDQMEDIDVRYVLEDDTKIEIASEGINQDDEVSFTIYPGDKRGADNIRSKLVSKIDNTYEKEIIDGVPIVGKKNDSEDGYFENAEEAAGLHKKLKERYTEEEKGNIKGEILSDDINSRAGEIDYGITEEGEYYFTEITFNITDLEGESKVEVHLTQQKNYKDDYDLRFIVDSDDLDKRDEIYSFIQSQKGTQQSKEEEEEQELDNLVEEVDVSMDDIGGLDDLKETLLKDIILPMKHSEEYEESGVEISNGILFHGPPGTGKTYTAKAVANEIDGGFYRVDDEILNKYVGQTEENLREVVETAQENGPSVVYIDEIDSLLSQREEASKQHQQSKTGTLLRLMDGFDPSDGVTFIASTNNPDKIDSALLRSGRLDKEIEVPLPDQEGREEILRKKLVEYEDRGANFEDIDVDRLASEVEATGADLDNWVRETVRSSVLPDEIDLENWSDEGTLLNDGPINLDDFLEAKKEIDFLEEDSEDETYEGPDWHYQ